MKMFKNIKLVGLFIFLMSILTIFGFHAYAQQNTKTTASDCTGTTTTSMWGTSKVTFCPSNGALDVEAGTLQVNDGTTIDNNGQISKNSIKIINLIGDVKSPVNSSFLFAGAPSPLGAPACSTQGSKYLINLTEVTGQLDTSLTNNMSSMFPCAASLTTIDVSGWDMSHVSSFGYLFYSSSGITALDVSNWQIGTDLPANTAVAADHAFYGLNKIMNIDVNSWDTSKIYEADQTFFGMTGLTSLDLSNWNMLGTRPNGDSFSYSNMLGNTNLQYINLGANTRLQSSSSNNVGLGSISTSGNSALTGGWVTNENDTSYSPTATPTAYSSSSNFMSGYDGSAPGWYTWQQYTTATAPVVESGAGYTIDWANGTLTGTLPCGPAYTTDMFKFADQTGVDFNLSISGNTLTVNAVAQSGYKLTGTTQWSITLPAITACKYTINYVLDGGTNATSNPPEYSLNDPSGNITLANPTKDNYDFGGWFSDASFTTKVTAIDVSVAADQTIYAKWAPTSYGITYNLDGGTNGEGNPDSYKYGTGVISFTPATKTGYTFNGWFNAASGGDQITSITNTDSGAMTLYAQYTANTYNITYETDGAQFNPNPLSYTFNQNSGNIGLLPPSKAGYTFVAWYDNASFTGNELSEIDVNIANDQTIYAKWQPDVYTITYVLDGGDNDENNPSSFTYDPNGADITLLPATKTGYTFNGWYNNDAFTGTPVTVVKVKALMGPTLYAKFTANVYTINYNVDGGANNLNNPANYTYDPNGTSITLLDPMKTGHTFLG